MNKAWRGLRLWPSQATARDDSAPRATAGFDANAATGLNARIRTLDLDEAGTILRARIAPNRTLRIRGWRFLRRTGLLSNRPGRQHRNNDRKEDFSHRFFYRVLRAFPTEHFAFQITSGAH